MSHDSIFLVLLGFLVGLYFVGMIVDLLNHATRSSVSEADIGKLIAAKKAADADKAAKATAYAVAHQVADSAAVELKSALASLGPVLVQNPDDTLEIWLPDATSWPVHKKTALATATVPAATSTS